MLNFEWDEDKNKSNQQKHHIDFEGASEIFRDENSIEFLSTSSVEPRILRIGKTFSKVILSVVYTIRNISIRIISARQASKEETMSYLGNILSKQSDDESENSRGH